MFETQNSMHHSKKGAEGAVSDREPTNGIAHNASLIDNWLWEVKGMVTTLDELEKRVQHLEQELAHLRQRLEKPEEEPAKRGARLLCEAHASQAAINAAAVKAFAEMGITGAPVGPEKLRDMMVECGVRTEDNAFSREVIAMREE